MDEEAIPGDKLLVLRPASRRMGSARVRIENGHSLQREYPLDQFCKLWAWCLVQINEQCAPAELVEMLHGRALQSGVAGTALFPRGNATYHKSADLKSGQRYPVLRIVNVQRETRGIEQIVEKKARCNRYHRGLPETAEDCLGYNDN